MSKLNFRKIFFALAASFVALGVGLATSLPASATNGYEITKYDIEVVVNENNTYDITEKITVNYDTSKHGIYRKIPLENAVVRVTDDAVIARATNRAKVTNVSVDDNYTTGIDGTDYVIKIGSADKYVTGEQSYTIKYNYNIGEDTLQGADELYLNLIGNEWDTTISGMSFSVKMPKEFDAGKVGFSVGSRGTSGYNEELLRYEVSGQIIKGEYLGTLPVGWAVTVRCELPEGYFVGAGLESPLAIVVAAVALMGLVAAFLLWNKYGKDDEVVETVEFYPPEGKNSLEVGQLYRGHAGSKDVVSLLIYLANKGYLKIYEEKKKNGKTKSFSITKVKDYDGNNDQERMFLAGLFSLGEVNEQGEKVVKSEDLTNSFYTTVNSILASIEKKEKKKIFEKNHGWKTLIVIAVSILVLFLVPKLEYGGEELALATAMRFDKYYLYAGIAAIVCIIGQFVLLALMSKRTKYGTEMLGKVRGLKTFLETAEKAKLEALVEENPSYFYDILPYTYVLGVSDKWIKKFEAIAIGKPDWYESNNAMFDYMVMSSFMNRTMNSVSSSMTSSPSSSSSGGGGGGFSGGGFSGGGSGGGGGGSW